MRKALVVRAGRGIGTALVERLIGMEADVVAYSGSPKKLARLRESFSDSPGFRAAQGDACDPDELLAAAEGADVIVCGVYLTYDEKPEKARRMLEAVGIVAERTGAKVVILEGIYRPAGWSRPETPAGSRDRYLRISVPELYGAAAADTLTHYAIRQVARGKPVKRLADPQVRREYLYLDDAARMAAELASTESAYGRSWRLRGNPPISGAELLGMAGAAAGRPVRYERVGGWMLRLLERYEPGAMELLERYNRGEEEAGGDEAEYAGGPATSYEAGMARTVARRNG
ncbi:NAD(P)H-binding protein [Cohnella xylanilytica]|uniref:NAD(P)H-binding protein n=1 Tax=Cohnella xylanilytica TaxID=557555 RepID=A0A841U4K9_9BACL|nr:NAD(P)H-binding protein [Cohnella xylanilytica]MBB6694048.1 NAD(P)H-binding protein [Cohnella xylanilytica]